MPSFRHPKGRLEKLGLLTPPDGPLPRVLAFDIETAPAAAWVWGAYKQNIIAIKEDWYLLCFAYQWFGTDQIGFERITKKADDKKLTEKLHALFDAADIVIAHNGDRFDIKKTNAQFLKHGFGPVSPYMSVDTLKESRRYFAQMQHGLDPLSIRHQLGEKTHHTGFDLWLGCMEMDDEAWAKMEEYNRHDIDLLVKLYDLLQPWIGSPGKGGGPNAQHWVKEEERPICTKITSSGPCAGKLVKRGTHRTKFSAWQVYRCKSCGGYSRARKRDPQDPIDLNAV